MTISQGCPASAIIFILVAEVMACKIRENDNINGLKTNDMNEDIKIVQHADDATLTLPDIKSVENAVKTIKEFGSMSGMKLNIDSITERCSHPGEDHTNEIKHDIHPEYWVDRDRFNIKTNMAAVYMTTGQL